VRLRLWLGVGGAVGGCRAFLAAAIVALSVTLVASAAPSAPSAARIAAAGALSFAPAVNNGAHTRPVSVAVGDLNGDGKRDLAVATGRSSVSLLLGKGDGSFQPAVNYSANPPTAARSRWRWPT
jgi:hypothetical protein